MTICLIVLVLVALLFKIGLVLAASDNIQDIASEFPITIVYFTMFMLVVDIMISVGFLWLLISM
jgi:hypothetical protein